MIGARPALIEAAGYGLRVADVSVRPARPDDAAEVARIQLATWRIAYAELLPARITAAVDDAVALATATQRWRAAVVEPPSPRHRVLVALEANTVVGFAAVEPAEADTDADTDGEPAEPAERAGDDAGVEGGVELGVLLVEPRWGRRGHGSRLVAAAVQGWRADGATAATVWVPEGDAASRAFYASAGWAEDGTVRTLDADGTMLREVRLRTLLTEEGT